MQRILHLPANTADDHLNNNITWICFEPGGRFLLALSSSHFHVWDLGRHAYDAFHASPVCSEHLSRLLDSSPDEFCNVDIDLCPISPAQPCDRIIFVISATFTADTTRRLHAMELQFPHNEAGLPIRLRRLATIRVAFFIEVTAMSNTCISLNAFDEAGMSGILVWDYRNDTIATWRVPTRDHIFSLFSSGSLAVFYYGPGHEMAIYRLPPFAPAPEGPITFANIPFPELRARTAPSIPTTHLPQTVAVNLWIDRCPWLCDTAQKPIFDMFTDDRLYRLTMPRMEPDTSGENTSGTCPVILSSIPFEKGFDWAMGHAPSHSDYGDNAYWLYTTQPRMLTCTMYRVTEGAPGPIHVDLLPCRANVALHDICPASGRICLTVNANQASNEGCEVHVWDFLVPDRAL